MTNRRILRLTGADSHSFLQGLITNDVDKLAHGPIYAAILTPQGKYIADFFVVARDGGILIDVAETLGDMLTQRLSMYKLRADVVIETLDLHLHRGLGAAPDGAYTDPRNPALGWRAYRDMPQADDGTDWDALRVAHMVPETGIELTPDSFILEMGFERLNGVDFRKGCYVGQEVTARMKHKTSLRKGLARVRLDGDAPTGTELTANGKPAGTVFTQAGGQGLAYLRFDRAKGPLHAGEVAVTWTENSDN